jgi:pimeloyl-ACP methyl ester carboxylesterase
MHRRHDMRITAATLRAVMAMALLAAPALLAATQLHAATAASQPLHVGKLTLHGCGHGAWCGVLERPLDPAGVIEGKIPIYFEYYPHSATAAAAGTLVAAEGGPGYPTTESRGDYLALFGPLRSAYDVLLMDYRGTGRSVAIDCRELQHAARLSEDEIGNCGASLGRTAPLYRTSLAADDLAALLTALGIERIALYGNSYGTYFAQVFALRHPAQLRALVLDGAYPLSGPDYGWYPNYAPATRRKFNVSCERSPACRVVPGSSLEHIAPALAQLRAQPFAAHVRYGADRTLDFTADASALATVMFAGSPAYASVRELDAAARAFSEDGDRQPLLRLMAETLGSVDSRDPGGSARVFSAGFAAAVFCQDPPQIFDMHLPPARRVAERDRLVAAREASAPDTYAPFAIGEYRRMPLDYAFIDECVRWPAVSAPDSPLTFAAERYPDVPVLVISGELDNMTSEADGQAAAAAFPHGHHVVIANSFHTNALPRARSDCAATLVRRFLRSLSTGDESCAGDVPAVRLVPRFARSSSEAPAARGSADNQASAAQLRVAQVALLTCEDVIVRARDNGPGSGLGLRGGTFNAVRHGEGYTLTLRDVRWTEDVSASGHIEWPGRRGMVRADLTLRAPEASGNLELLWPEGTRDPRATVRGRLDGNAVIAEAAAP